jgi:HEAT repeat protein
MDIDRLNQLEAQLRSPALNIRIAALNVLAQVDSAVAVPMLGRLAEDPDFLYRRLGVMGLGNHPTAESFALLRALVAQEEDANVMAEAANSLLEFGAVGIGELAQLFRVNDHWLVRQTIFGVVADEGCYDVLMTMIRLGLADPVVTTRETAILALGKLVGTALEAEAIEVLLQIAQSEFWRDRWRAATTLCAFKCDLAKAMLGRLRQDENHYVVAAALESGF